MSAGRPEVAVVGAGPVGLSLGLGLARAGRRVVVLERNASTTEHSRAPAIWPRTQEALAGLGVVDRFLEEGALLREPELWDADRGRVLLRLPLRELADETPYPQLLILPQSDTERLLREALEGEPSADLRFSSEVVGLRRDDARVRLDVRTSAGREELVVPWVAGCDGAHSTVREALGAEFPGTTYAIRAALADVRLEGGRDRRFPRVSSRDGVVVALRVRAPGPAGDGGLWRLILPLAADDARPLGERIESAVRHLFDGASYRTAWKSTFRLHRRVASRFADGRVALAGDAAHLNSPVGGQGMNSGIRDARALTRALEEALDGGDPGPLEAYGRRRRADVSEGVNRFTDRLTRVLLAGRGRFVKPVLRSVSLALRLPPLRRRFLRRLAMLDGGG